MNLSSVSLSHTPTKCGYLLKELRAGKNSGRSRDDFEYREHQFCQCNAITKRVDLLTVFLVNKGVNPLGNEELHRQCRPPVCAVSAHTVQLSNLDALPARRQHGHEPSRKRAVRCRWRSMSMVGPSSSSATRRARAA
eukprot:COSAG03_NODE_35_length_17808_cov_11.200971_7_plen_137_part_00